MTPEQFINKWKKVLLPYPPEGPSERTFSQEHFIDLCRLINHKTPGESDSETFRFEKPLTKVSGSKGFADVFKKEHFGWEYKGPHKNLDSAYIQLKLYTDALENPPLLVVSDMVRFRIHTNFTSTIAKVYEFTFEELVEPEKLAWLKAVFTRPYNLKPNVTRAGITKDAADKFSKIARSMNERVDDARRVAHFLNRLIFCMFAEDAGLLPNGLFLKLVARSLDSPELFEGRCRELFAAMHSGGEVAYEEVQWFNGGLFDSSDSIPMTPEELQSLYDAAELDWQEIEPSIFGTLFERGLDPAKRSQLGAHYTDTETIMKIVRPVVLDPWLHSWDEAKAQIKTLVDKAYATSGGATTKALKKAQQLYDAYLDRLGSYRICDPACGSGNFLYLSLKVMKDFEKRVRTEAGMLGVQTGLLFEVGPQNLYGIEINPYAAELARVSIWIGELQWMLANGYGYRKDPILRNLNQIENRDALLKENGAEAEWPEADVIVGNPPFLGDKMMRGELGNEYTEALRRCYHGRVSGGADLVMFWFEKAHQQIIAGKLVRAGLVATNSIRQQRNRIILQQICDVGQIYNAWGDEEWVTEGAEVRVSLVCFTGKDLTTAEKTLDGVSVGGISASLSVIGGDAVDLTKAVQLSENLGKSFFGLCLAGAFDIPGDLAREWLKLPNPNGRPNSDVLRPLRNGNDIQRRNQDRWVIDFGHTMTETDASLYEAPFSYVVDHVKPVRLNNLRPARARNWWRHGETRPGMRKALDGLKRFIVTVETTKHRVFSWLPITVAPEHNLIVIPDEREELIGVLSSRIHVLWATSSGGRLGVGNDPRYNSTRCFNTFPFPAVIPLVPSITPEDDEIVQKVAVAALNLLAARDRWLNPPEWTDVIPESTPCYPDRIIPLPEFEKDIKKRTLTNLYNQRPAWLDNLHRDLDIAVAAAYCWEWPLSDREILKRLFMLNKDRA